MWFTDGSGKGFWRGVAWLLFVALGAGTASAQVTLQHFEGDPNGNYPNQFGWSVSAIGDINGDQVPDLVIGAPGWAVGGPCFNGQPHFETGFASIVSGLNGALIRRHTGIDYTCGCGSCGPIGGSRLGISVAAIGDVNNDGIPDYVVGSDRGNPAGGDSGRATIYSGTDGAVLYQLNGTAAGDFFGNWISAAGDVDMDGVPDVLVAAPSADLPLAPNCGSIRVVSGSSGSTITTFFGSVSGAEMRVCDRIGDVNGDGHDDALVGAHFENSLSFLRCGRVSVFSGTAPHPLLLVFEGTANNEELGYRVAGAGDLNRDGYPDILATSKGVTPRVVRVYDTFGSTLVDIPAPANSVSFGDSIAGAGDVDGDLWGDFLVADPGFDGGKGIVYVYSLPNGVLTLISTLPAYGGEPNGKFGSCVAGVGHWDTTTGTWIGGHWNADSLDDIVVGAPHEFFDRGRVWIYSGTCLSPTNYCTSTLNSSGQAATIGFQGSLSVGLNNLVLTAQHCPLNKNGIFYYGPLQVQVPFGCGYRCVGGNISRLPIVNTGSGGAVAYAINYANPPASSTLLPGSTWNFQFWFRDPGSCGNGVVNLSDGLSGTFCP
jgi:hypothetical protein